MQWGATRVPLERVGTPEDIAPLYVYLASDESGYTTGGEFAIDGGGHGDSLLLPRKTAVRVPPHEVTQASAIITCQ